VKTAWLAIGLMNWVACASLAQETPLHRKIAVRFDSVPLADALKDIGEKVGVRFACADALLEGADPVVYEAKDQEAGRVATRILRPRGLKLEKAEGSPVAVARLDPLEELRVKREELFAFSEEPSVTREGDRVTIAFASKGWCDATVAVEDASGRIVRHLASGVLGANAPEPFQWNSKRQVLVWDGKDDQGAYVDDKESVTVRVSLGLKPQFERTLFWSPHKRISASTPLVRAAPEGVYVYDGQVLDHVRLFDHQGRYVRTIYPFPREKLKEVQGLTWHTFVQTGTEAPLKVGYHQAGLLTSGSNDNPRSHEEGRAAFALAVRGDRIALAHLKLNRLSSDGSTGGLPLEGPETSLPMIPAQWGGHGPDRPRPRPVSPWSAEFNPDGKRLYLAGYAWTFWDTSKWDCFSAVMALDYERNAPPALFAGSLKQEEVGKGPGQFHCATSVACDATGRVYVSDYMNDRIQVFSPDGRLLRSVEVPKPALVRVHQKTGEIFVFSWPVHNVELTQADAWKDVTPKLTHLGPVDNPRKLAEYPLPLPIHGNWWAKHPPGPMYGGEVDSWAEPPTIWISSLRGDAVERGLGVGGDGFGNYGAWERCGVKGFVPESGKLVLRYDFGKETGAAAVRATPPILSRQRLYVNPASGKLYVAEGDCGVMKAVNQLVEIAPDTGKIRLVDLPLGAEDFCFDLNGLLYLRTDTAVARYDPVSWREVPWDYGEERRGHSYGMSARGANLFSALITPGHRSFNFWHLGGMDVNARGHLAVTTCNGAGMSAAPVIGPQAAKVTDGSVRKGGFVGKPYEPAVFPGRARWGEIHIWDRHGKLVRADAIPGMGHLNGIGMDAADCLYMLSASRRLIDGKPIDPGVGRDVSGTLVKVSAGRAKVLSAAGSIPVPLPADSRPRRPQDLTGYTTGWVEHADWLYGGVGFCTPGGCVCWNCRFDLDDFSRSFVPEPLTFGVGVLDSGGNLILRVGRCGNVNDGKPLDQTGGPPGPRSIGGDEVALLHACYVASHTDRRLFIADAGNARILSVRLAYHAEKKVALKDVKETGKAR